MPTPPVPSGGGGPSTDVKYLRSPISTVLESIEDIHQDYVTSHDLVEAYNTLCSRLKVISGALCDESARVPALRSLEEHAVPFIQCLRKHVRGALVDPLLSPSQRPLTLGAAFRPYQEPLTVVNEEDIKLARDTALLCQSALRVVSYVLRFPAFHAVFAAHDITHLAEDVLDLLDSPGLPIPNAKKIQALALWVISRGHLPMSLVASRDIMKILHESTKSGCDCTTICDGLKTLVNLLRTHPSLILRTCTPMMTPVLRHLGSDETSIRLEAADALSGFAFALLSHPPYARKDLVGLPRDILRYHVGSTVTRHNSNPGDYSIVTSIMGGLGLSDKLSPVRGVMRILIALASIIAIMGASVFTHKAILKLVFKTLELPESRTLRSIRQLHALIWRCLVWAFMELRADEPPSSKVRRNAFNTVKQERRHGVATVLMTYLLGPPLAHSAQGNPSNTISLEVQESIAVLRGMAEDRGSVRAEARAVLSRLTSAIGSAPTPPSTPAPDGTFFGEGILVRELFDGTILRASDEQLSTLLPTLVRPSAERIRPLTEPEIVGNWDGLVAVWSMLVKKDILARLAGFTYPHDLLGAWQALLLVLAQLTQERRHLTASPECAVKVAEIFQDILTWHDDAIAQHANETVLRQNPLRFALMMWKIAKNVFNASWLAAVSEPVLRAVLQQTYDLMNKDVADAWAQLISALVLAGPDDVLHRLAVGDEAKQETELKRHLWSLLAKCWTSAETKPDWKNSISLVTLPVGHFALSDDDLVLWQELVNVTILSAQLTGDSSDQVLEHIATHFRDHSERLSQHTRMAICLLSHLTLHDERAIPKTFLNAVDDLLRDLYPAKQEDRYPVLQSYHILTTLLRSCPQDAIVSLVSTISDGLCIWIRDEEEVLLDQEYNEIIMPLYQTTLERIADYQFAPDTLETIAPFLASAFKRMPPPAIGPTAFKAFWDDVWPHVTLSSSRLPDDFKQALRINHNFFGGHLPSDMSNESQSQSQFDSQDESVVPETPSSQLVYGSLPLLPNGFSDDHVGNVSAPRREVIDPSHLGSSEFRRIPPHPEQHSFMSTSGPSCSLYHGHALTEDYPSNERYGEASSSEDTPLALVYGAHNGSTEDKEIPTASPRHPAMPRASSAALSPEVPFLRRDQSSGPSPSHLSPRRANSAPGFSHRDTTCSVPIPGSPMSRKRTRLILTDSSPQQPQPSHPPKKRKVTPEESVLELASLQTSREGRQTSIRPRNNATSVQQVNSGRPPTKKKFVFDGVLVPPLRDRLLWEAASDKEPSSSLSGLPPSSPAREQSQREVSLGLSDDYDTWEATINPADVRELQHKGDPLSDIEPEVEARLTSSQIVDESILVVPSSQEDEILMPPSNQDVEKPAMHTSLSTSNVHDAVGRDAQLRRANTTSNRLDLLRCARDKIAAGGSQLPAEAVEEAEGMLHDMYQVLQRARSKHTSAGQTKPGQKR